MGEVKAVNELLIASWNQCVKDKNLNSFIAKMDQDFSKLKKHEQLMLLHLILYTPGNAVFELHPENPSIDFSTLLYNPLVTQFLIEWQRKSSANEILLDESISTMRAALNDAHKNNILETHHLTWMGNLNASVEMGLAAVPYCRTIDNNYKNEDVELFLFTHVRSCFFQICHYYDCLPKKYLNHVNLKNEMTSEFLNNTINAIRIIREDPRKSGHIIILPPVKVIDKLHRYNCNYYTPKFMDSIKSKMDNLMWDLIFIPGEHDHKLHAVWKLYGGFEFEVKQTALYSTPMAQGLRDTRQLIINFISKNLKKDNSKEVMRRIDFMAKAWMKVSHQSLNFSEFIELRGNSSNRDLLQPWGKLLHQDKTVCEFSKLMGDYLSQVEPVNVNSEHTAGKVKNSPKNEQSNHNDNQPNVTQEQLNKLYEEILKAEEQRKQAEERRTTIEELQNQLILLEIELQEAESDHNKAREILISLMVAQRNRGNSPTTTPVTIYKSLQQEKDTTPKFSTVKPLSPISSPPPEQQEQTPPTNNLTGFEIVKSNGSPSNH